jgi:hypothetical protein
MKIVVAALFIRFGAGSAANAFSEYFVVGGQKPEVDKRL